MHLFPVSLEGAFEKIFTLPDLELTLESALNLCLYNLKVSEFVNTKNQVLQPLVVVVTVGVFGLGSCGERIIK